MTALLPRALGRADLPPAELHAARLDGELFPLGRGWCPADALDGPETRLAAALADQPPGTVAVLETAAWVWGARTSPPELWEFATSVVAHRLRQPDDVRLRQLSLAASDVVRFAGELVTTPARTCVDLARDRAAWGDAERELLGSLAAVTGVGLAECLAGLPLRRRLAGASRARRRLREALASC